jgi:hypothetical protein
LTSGSGATADNHGRHRTAGGLRAACLRAALSLPLFLFLVLWSPLAALLVPRPVVTGLLQAQQSSGLFQAQQSRTPDPWRQVASTRVDRGDRHARLRRALTDCCRLNSSVCGEPSRPLVLCLLRSPCALTLPCSRVAASVLLCDVCLAGFGANARSVGAVSVCWWLVWWCEAVLVAGVVV